MGTSDGGARSKYDAGYGRGTIELRDDELLVDGYAAEVTAGLRRHLQSSDYAPPVLPAAALDVYRLSRERDVKIEQILQVLEKDPLLAARVLKVASSPLYGGQAAHSLQAAVVRLGLRNLAEVVWDVALHMKVFRSKSYEQPMELVRRHSLAVAHLSRAAAKLTPVPLDYAFLCGLLHDVGAAAILLVLEETHVQRRGRALPPEVLDMVLRTAHAEASALVAQLWSLPFDVALVLEHHHTVTIAGHAHPTAALIAVAESLLAEEGDACGSTWAPGWDETKETVWSLARAALKLSPVALNALRKDARGILERMEQS